MLEIVTQDKNKLAYSVAEAANSLSLSKAHIRNEIRAGNLRAKKVGRRVLILQKDINEYLENQEDWEPSKDETNI